MTLQLISRACQINEAGSVPRKTGSVVGVALLGQDIGTLLPDWPVQHVIAPLLGVGAPLIQETWLLAGHTPFAGKSEGIAWCRAGNLLYGVIELNEALFADTVGCSPLQAASEEAYRRIFRLLEAQQLPHLWRVWNYLADITGESHGLERYRQFNIGRQDAFLEFSRGATGNVPAASAIGLADSPLSIAFLAGDQPAVPVENPRQVSAYHYPAAYGPRSPTFSRGALVYPPGQEILFISGTASIVGHQTVHPGDVVSQCREALANVAAVVAAVVAEANRRGRSPPYALNELSYRVYIRHAEDFPAVRDTLSPLIGAKAEVVYLQTDICRADLLLEVEAMASHTLGNC